MAVLDSATAINFYFQTENFMHIKSKLGIAIATIMSVGAVALAPMHAAAKSAHEPLSGRG